MDVMVDSLQFFTIFLIKSLLLRVEINLFVVLLKMKLCQTKNKPKNYASQLLETLKNVKYTHLIWGADLAGVQLISKFNKVIRFLLRIIDIYSKCTCVISLKD